MTDTATLSRTTEEMLSRMVSLDDARERLAPTEGLTEYEFATDGSTNKLKFNFPENWYHGLDQADDFAPTTASVDIDGTEIPLTKNGALDLASTIGLQGSYAQRTPGTYIEPQLDYWYSHGANGKRSLKLLAGNSGGIAVTRGTVTPFSNAQLLDSVTRAIERKYGSAAGTVVDYKWNNAIDKTNMRLVVPSATRNINSARVAKGSDDPWSLGIEINNSLDGSGSLELRGYLFAWWCTNGATVQRASSGKYRRKPSLTPDDAYAWAENVAETVLDDLAQELDAVEQLTMIPLEGELNETVGNLFERFRVPADTRQAVLYNLVESDDLTAYGLMNAVTAAANDPSLSANAVNNLLSIGGDVAHVLSGRCDVCHRF